MTNKWFPKQLETILGRRDFSVILFDDIDCEILIEDLERTENIGLASLKKETNANLLCLTTENRICVFNLEDPKHKDAIVTLLNKKNVRYFTRDGTYDALVLKETLMLDITQFNHFYDLTCIDLHLRLEEYREIHKGIRIDSETLVKSGPRQNYYAELVAFRLDGDKIDMNCSQEEISALKHLPLSSIANQCIMKKCVLTAKLASKLWKLYNMTIKRRSRFILSFGIKADDQLMERYTIEKTGSYAQFCEFLQQCPQ